MMEFRNTIFGEQLVYQIPDECKSIVLCVDRHQHCPISVLLPHQIYRHDLKELIEQYPDARSITILPVRNDAKVCVSLDLISAPNDENCSQEEEG